MRPALRDAVAADRPAAAALCAAAMRAAFAPFSEAAALDAWLAGGAAGRYLDRALDRAVIAEDDDGAAGLAVVEADLVDLLWVSPARRGRGLGRALMAEAERRIAAGGRREARLEMFAPNAAAARFYRRLGWREGRRWTDPEAGVEKVELTKRLGRGHGRAL